MFDRNGFDPFARGRRNSLSKKSKMKQIKQPAAPSIVKQADYSQVCYHVIANIPYIVDTNFLFRLEMSGIKLWNYKMKKKI